MSPLKNECDLTGLFVMWSGNSISGGSSAASSPKLLRPSTVAGFPYISCRPKPFRFRVAWTTNEGFERTLWENWHDNNAIIHALQSLLSTLNMWSREVFSNLFRRKRKLWVHIQGIQRKIMNPNRNINDIIPRRGETSQEERILAWNVHGARNKYFLQEFNKHLRIHRPQFVALLETDISGERAEEVCRRSGYDHWYRSELTGFIGDMDIIGFLR
ncbi:hypothetical protein Cgig2_033461 [Carnegiea gigantea]|uniref:Uncharacterized protein n=1 Tax=Carnegiea gigantea TaxID=171969 RepID=A0A9Q1JMS9_9CARY|nr:hypothetical protein Cgig2_033461 [Carnegiea gigantea]